MTENKKIYTIEDIEALPEGERAELIDCEVFMSPVAVYLSKKHNYVEPDIMIICDKGKLDDRGCYDGPDFVVEVVSKSSVKMDYFLKLFKYAESGVREYWIVDPERQRVWVYHFEQGEFEIDFSKINI